ncbi:ABC transporter ATP-binding protein/permease, partial [Singulisphaera rosea]
MIDDFRGVSRRFFLDLRSFFSSEVRWKALGWSGTLVVVLLSINVLNVLNSYVGRDFMTAISDRDRRGFRLYAILYLCVFAGSTVAAVFSRFSEERLRLLWRTWLTETLMDRYLDEHAYLRLETAKEVDNPDQRITEDVKAYTQTTLSFFLLSLNATITSVAFLGVLWSITPWLVATALGYATVGTLATIGLGRSLVRLDNRQLKVEADLRYALIRVRECSETIAVMGIEGTMRARLQALLTDLVQNNRAIIAVSRNLGFLTNGYNYLLQIVPLLIVAPLYMSGRVEFGVVTQSLMAFAQVLGAFSLIVTQFETLSSFAAVSGRLHTITSALEEARTPLASSIEVVERSEGITFDQLTLRASNRRAPLIKGLSISIGEGENLFVSGPDDRAKMSLFLATAGVRQEGEGRIERPGHGELMLVPRQLFAPRGTLRE